MVFKLYGINDKFISVLESGVHISEPKIELDVTNIIEKLSFEFAGGKVPSRIRKKFKNNCVLESETQRYIVRSIDGASVSCDLDLGDLERTVIDFTYGRPFDGVWHAGSCANAMLRQAGLTTWHAEETGTYGYYGAVFTSRHKTPLQILQQIADGWACEVWVNAKTRTVYIGQRGEDAGVYMLAGFNAKSITRTGDSYDLYTRLYPYGKDGLTIEAVNGGKPYIDNTEYTSIIRSTTWENTEIEDAGELLKAAKKKLDDISQPRMSYMCDVVDLARVSAPVDLTDENGHALTDEDGRTLQRDSIYSQYALGIGDIIQLKNYDQGIDTQQRIVKMTLYPDDPIKNTCELSSASLSYEDMQNRLQKQVDAWKNDDGSINGYYVHGISADNRVVIQTMIDNAIKEAK